LRFSLSIAGVGTIGNDYAIVPPLLARATIARTILIDVASAKRVGSIELQPHQVEALARIADALSRHSVALLCDPAGTGKTFTALAAIPRGSHDPVVVAPAVLRAMWINAAERAGVAISFTSFESLSRGKVPDGGDFVIVDEAHHARTPNTVRYRLLAQIVANLPTVMLTATPLHNRRRDLESLLRLKLGEQAADLTDEELGQCIIRRDDLRHGLPLPHVTPIIWHELKPDERIAGLLLSLPPPLPPSDGGDGGALVIHSLVRQWASTDAALRGALKRRLAQANALVAALDDGTWPTRRELASWITDDADVQLSFAGFLASPSHKSSELIEVVKVHRMAVGNLLDEMSGVSKADTERAERILEIRRASPAARIVVFSAFAESVDAMYRLLAPLGKVAALTSAGARVVGGRMSRRDAIECFAPQASGVRAPRECDEITLLVTTDLLSEGVNLQDASTVIHLDLPWTPARLEQRSGRLARIGSIHSEVAAHAFRPPASAEQLVHIERILEQKSTIGRAESDRQNVSEAVRRRLSSWMLPVSGTTVTVVGCVQSCADGFVAAYNLGERPGLVASLDGRLSDSPAIVLRALDRCEGHSSSVRDEEIHDVLYRIRNWTESSAALEHVGGADGVHSVRRHAHRAVDGAVRNSRSHERAATAALASKVRARLRQRLGHFVETQVIAHLESRPHDSEWLETLLEILAEDDRAVQSAAHIAALVILKK
jgi:superfamily II DNA or RNA helicase